MITGMLLALWWSSFVQFSPTVLLPPRPHRYPVLQGRPPASCWARGRRLQRSCLFFLSCRLATLTGGGNDRTRHPNAPRSAVACPPPPPPHPPVLPSGDVLGGFTWPASLHPQRNDKDTPAPPRTVEEIGLLKATQALFIVGASTAGHVPRQGPLSELKTGCKQASWLAGCRAHSLSWGSSPGAPLRELGRTEALRGLRP